MNLRDIFFNNFSPLRVRNVWELDRRICSVILGVKGLKIVCKIRNGKSECVY